MTKTACLPAARHSHLRSMDQGLSLIRTEKPAIYNKMVWLFLAAVSTALLAALPAEPDFEWAAMAAACGFLAALWGICLLMHRMGGYDPWLLAIAGAANVAGLLLAFRLGLYYRQTAYSIAGLALLLAVVLVTRTYPSWPKASRPLALAAMGVLALTALAGRQINGAKSWLFIGPIGLEPSQPALVFFTMAAETALRDGPWQLWFVPVAVGLLAATHNLGAVLVLALVLGTTAYLAGWNRSRLVLAAGCFLALALVTYFTFPVVPTRLHLWLAPTGSTTGSLQMAKSFAAFAKGGLAGAGFTAPQGIPVAASDFVFAAWAEIAGVWGAWTLLGLYVFFLYRALSARPGSSPLGGALGLLLTCQAFLLAGGNTGLLPLTGVAMPFVSRGGSTLFANYLATALLLVHGPPVRPGRRERAVFWAACVAAALIGFSALLRSLAG